MVGRLSIIIEEEEVPVKSFESQLVGRWVDGR